MQIWSNTSNGHRLNDRLANREIPDVAEIRELISNRNEAQHRKLEVSIRQKQQDARVDELGNENKLHDFIDDFTMIIVTYLLDEDHVDHGH